MPQIRRIVRTMPAAAVRHTLLFSATLPAPIQQLAKEFLRPYVWIGVGRVGSTVEGIEQRVWLATADKRAKLALVVKALADRSGRSLVFVEKVRDKDPLAVLAGSPVRATDGLCVHAARSSLFVDTEAHGHLAQEYAPPRRPRGWRRGGAL